MVLAIRILLPSGQTLGASMTLRVLAPNVEIAHPTAAYVPATDGQVLAEGDRARTDAAGHGVVNFFDGSSLELDSGTEIAVTTVETRDGGAFASLSQTIGRTWSSIRKQPNANSRYEIKTPAATAVVRGTGFEVLVGPDGATIVRVADGTVTVSAQGVDVQVRPGFQSTVAPGQPPTPAAPLTVSTLRVALRSNAGAFIGVLDRLNRACGFLDPAALGIAIPGPFEVNQAPLCAATPPSGGVATVEIGEPTAGKFTIVLFSGDRPGPFALEASGVLGPNLAFDIGASGDLAAGELQATQLTLAVAPNGTLSSSSLSPMTRVGPVPVAADGTPPAGALAVVTLGNAPPVAVVPVAGAAALASRPILLLPPGTTAPLATIFGGGGLLLAALFLFRDFLRPAFFLASVSGVMGMLVAGIGAMLWYRDWIIGMFNAIGNALK